MEVLGVADPEEAAEEAGVGKIELRAFDQPLCTDESVSLADKGGRWRKGQMV